MMFNRQLSFIVLGNKGTGKTTFIKQLKKNKNLFSDPTIKIEKYKAKIKLLSSKKARLFSRERWRRYSIKIIDVPGDFAYRRMWRLALKSMRGKKLIFVVLFKARATIADNQSALEEVYNQYLESIDYKDIDHADEVANKKPLLLLIVLNQQDQSSPISLDNYYSKHLKGIVNIIKTKINLLEVERFSINLLNISPNDSNFNNIFESMKKFVYS